jgi:hypothetical protein
MTWACRYRCHSRTRGPWRTSPRTRPTRRRCTFGCCDNRPRRPASRRSRTPCRRRSSPRPSWSQRHHRRRSLQYRRHFHHRQWQSASRTGLSAGRTSGRACTGRWCSARPSNHTPPRRPPPPAPPHEVRCACPPSNSLTVSPSPPRSPTTGFDRLSWRPRPRRRWCPSYWHTRWYAGRCDARPESPRCHRPGDSVRPRSHR